MRLLVARIHPARLWLALTLALAIVLLTPNRRCFARPEDEVPPRLDAAVAKALAYLARQQDTAGAFDKSTAKVSVTGLSLLSFMACGQAPDVGKYGFNLRNAVDFLLARQARDGYFGAGERGMFTHAVATLALTQAYGLETSLSRRNQMYSALKNAVAVIVAAQSSAKPAPASDGGWRQERDASEADPLVSAWTILALRGAQDCGLTTPPAVRQRALGYVVRFFDEAAKDFEKQGASDLVARTAMAIDCLTLLDAAEANANRIESGTKYLVKHPLDDNVAPASMPVFFVAQAAFQHGDDSLARLGRTALERLIRTQDKDGGWPADKSAESLGRNFSTALSLASLAVPYRLMPVYHR